MPETKEYIKKRRSKEQKLDRVFINIAKEIATLSYCERAKVGAIIVKDKNIISFGYNGTPTGMDNKCEDCQNRTEDHVIHAEMNAILKAAKEGHSVEGSTLYLTLSPCKECAKLILQSGIKKVVYLDEYRDVSGIKILKQFIEVEQYA